ncbi:MAG: YcaO-like family protein [Actinomycetaceae bacterium]|nr:YcaO-like family protein [Actinomycetaceae bacterium]
MIRYRGSDSFTRPWGGHCENFNDATRLGILEGIERVACESAPAGTVTEHVPENTPKIGLDQFGVDIGPWKTPDPRVAAWTSGRVLDEQEANFLGQEVALPERLVYYAPTTDLNAWVQDSSNGCALGGTVAEAILFGLLEAVERDAFLAAWYAGLDLVPIRQDTIEDATSRSYLQRLELNGVKVVLLDATIGVQIPTVIAVCEEPGGSTCVGAGCHPDPERALKSALIEVASDFQVVAEHREQRGSELEAMLADYSLVRVMEDHADLFAHPKARPLIAHWRHPKKEATSLKALSRSSDAGKTVEDDLRFSIQQCREAGFEPVACNLTDGLARAVGAHVWKVVIPGLIPIDFGRYQRVYSMSRLESVARSFGDLPADAPFEPVPIPHPFP